jgi:hypothetical protein
MNKFDSFYDHSNLAYFLVICDIIHNLVGILYQEKSGNPGPACSEEVKLCGLFSRTKFLKFIENIFVRSAKGSFVWIRRASRPG